MEPLRASASVLRGSDAVPRARDTYPRQLSNGDDGEAGPGTAGQVGSRMIFDFKLLLLRMKNL